MDDINVEFKDLVNAYVGLDVNFKRKELIDELKTLIAVFESLLKENGIEYPQLKSREILDLKESNVSEADYLEALYVYVQVLKEHIGHFLNAVLESRME